MKNLINGNDTPASLPDSQLPSIPSLVLEMSTDACLKGGGFGQA
ncbi:MAG: hypothetical protein O2829_02855 [Bacteroidetes bacterium]|nr:hypothetical protein [Bacteroidota bacterium]MDA1268011.1 hypothetical protein [Bacteroidota bacterium]